MPAMPLRTDLVSGAECDRVAWPHHAATEAIGQGKEGSSRRPGDPHRGCLAWRLPGFEHLPPECGDPLATDGIVRVSAGRARVRSGTKNMRSLAGSAFSLVVLLPASLGAGPLSDATPVVAHEPMSGRSHPQAVKAACALAGSCVAQASAGEPDEIRPVTGQSPAPTPSSVPAAIDSVCRLTSVSIDEIRRTIWGIPRGFAVSGIVSRTIVTRS